MLLWPAPISLGGFCCPPRLSTLSRAQKLTAQRPFDVSRLPIPSLLQHIDRGAGFLPEVALEGVHDDACDCKPLVKGIKSNKG